MIRLPHPQGARQQQMLVLASRLRVKQLVCPVPNSANSYHFVFHALLLAGDEPLDEILMKFTMLGSLIA